MLLSDALYHAIVDLNSVTKEFFFPEYPIEIQEETKELITKIQTLNNKCRSNNLDNKAKEQYQKKIHQT
jgi:hypothetical protein